MQTNEDNPGIEAGTCTNTQNHQTKGEKTMKKTMILTIGIVVSIIICLVTNGVAANNTAIRLEEQIREASASIQVQEKRRVDLLYNMVDAVLSYADYESKTMLEITQARNSLASGEAEQAGKILYAISEAYPELKANESYQKYMTELALTENRIAEYRENYNNQVKAYNKFTRSFPTRMWLQLFGYESIDATYTEYDAPEDAPVDLFARG